MKASISWARCCFVRASLAVAHSTTTSMAASSALRFCSQKATVSSQFDDGLEVSHNQFLLHFLCICSTVFLHLNAKLFCAKYSRVLETAHWAKTTKRVRKMWKHSYQESLSEGLFSNKFTGFTQCAAGTEFWKTGLSSFKGILPSMFITFQSADPILNSDFYEAFSKSSKQESGLVYTLFDFPKGSLQR